MDTKTSRPLRGITRRGNVFWLRFRQQGHLRQISLQTNDPAEAVTRALKARNAPELAPKAGLEIEVEQFIAAKRKAGRFTSEATAKWARRALKHLITFFPSKSVTAITHKDMERFVAHLLANQAETGAMAYMRGIKSFFSWAVKEKLRFENPCAGLVREPKEPARKKFATKDQRDALLQACEAQRVSKDPAVRASYHEPLHFALFCALHAGMRYNEIIQARADWFNLDVEQPYVEVKNTLTFMTKNRRSRTVPLTTPFVKFLKRYKLREPFMLQADKVQGKSSYRYDFRKPWTNHVTAMGVPWLTPHNARRTFGSLLVQSGQPLFKVSKWLGHSNAVCEKHYAHLSPGDSGIDAML